MDRPKRKLGIIVTLLALVVVGSLIFQAFAGPERPEAASVNPAPTPSATAVPVEPTTTVPTTVPTSTTEPTEIADAGTSATPPTLVAGVPETLAAAFLEAAPLGTFVIARPNAGIFLTAPDGPIGHVELPVFDEPGGDARMLVDQNLIDGIDQPISLINWPDADGLRVMRLIAGGPDDQWLVVQAPTRPHDQFTWVRRDHFDFGFTSMRIEIDLAEGAGLTLLDGDEEVLTSAIVHGRDGRETPTHLTHIELGVSNELGQASPAYGSAILRMASFSEVLGTFGGGVPSNFLHGTNNPELIGQRLSSGGIRVPNEVLDAIIETITPGTPVLLFDTGSEDGNRDAILARQPTLAPTVRFTHASDGVADVISGVTPQIWNRCNVPAVAERCS